MRHISIVELKGTGKNKEKGKSLCKNKEFEDKYRGLQEYAAKLTVESHNMEFPDDPWEIEVEDDSTPISEEISEKTLKK